MKKVICFLLIGMLQMSSVAYARDTIGDYSIEEALNLDQSKSALGQDVKFYFGDQSHGKVIKTFGEFTTSKKTNAFNKTDKAACQWAFLSAMVSLKERAVREGGNAVINIKSNYRNHLTSSNTTFQCGAGAIIAGVALVGTVVKIGK
jgi:uncharacterized protein YbjQ (UPF0145 family)